MAGTVKEEAIKLRQNIDKVYEAGRQSFNDDYQQGGTRTEYSCAYAGCGWTTDTFKPVYNMQPTNAYMMFRGSLISGDLVQILEELNVVLDFSQCTTMNYVFSNAINITRFGIIDIRAHKGSINGDNTFSGCFALERVDCLVVNEECTFNIGIFGRCSVLKYVGIEGFIGNSISFQYSPLLTDECVQGIIDHLATVATQQTLTFHADVYNKLTADQKTTIESKNWEVKSA